MADGTIDTSIYKSAAPTNPLATMATGVGVANAVNQNRLFQQKFEANKAIGSAYQQSIDPETGKLDSNKLLSIVAGNPKGAFLTGEVAGQAQAREKEQLGIDTARLELAQKHIANVDKNLGALIDMPDLSLAHATDALVRGVQDGRWTPQNAVKYIGELSAVAGGKPASEQSAAIRTRLQEYRMRNLTSAEQLQATSPAPTVVDHGGGKLVMRLPQVGQPSLEGTIANTVTPEFKASRVQAVGPGNVPVSIPQASITDDYGNPRAPAAPAQTGTLGTGRMNAPDAGGGAPAAAPQAAAPAVPGMPAGALQTGLAPGVEPAANVTATANANQGVQLQQLASNVPQRKALLGNLEADLEKFTSGPGADWTKVATAAANRATESMVGFSLFDPKSIAAQEDFNKQATQLAQQQFQALGGTGTDSKLDSAMKTSPYEELSKLGNRKIIHMLKGNEDAIATMNQEWQRAQLPKAEGGQGMGGQDYGRFVTEFNKSYDPRAFQWQYMGPDERKDSLKGMTKDEQSKFRSAYNMAVQRGWVPDPRAANGG